jgi:hypothetical protein
MKLTEESTSMAGSDSNGNTQGLTLEQILLLKPPHGVSLSFDHLGTLFHIDEEKNGYISENNLINFTKYYYETYCNIVKNDSITTDDAYLEMDGHFTLGLWKYVIKNEGSDAYDTVTHNTNDKSEKSDDDNDVRKSYKEKNISLLVNWLLLVIKNLGPLHSFNSQPEIEFIHSDHLHSLYKLIDIRSSYNIDFQAFLDVVQRAGEDAGWMHLDETDFDDVVPVVVVEMFLTEYFGSIINMMNELDFVG